MFSGRRTCSGKASAAWSAVLAFGLLATNASCTSQDQKKRRPAATVAPPQNATQCPKPAEPPALMSRLTYEVAVVDFLNLAKCDRSTDCVHDPLVEKRATGEVTLDTMSDFSMKFVSGQIIARFSILGRPLFEIPIDITKTLGQFSPDSTQCDPQGNLSTDADGRILMTKRLGNIQFEPPRPLLLGPVIQDPSDFDGLQRLYPNIHYSSVPGSTGPPVDGYAGLLVRVINTRLPLKVQYEPKPVEVMHWEMTLVDPNGRGAAQNMEALLPERLAFYWRTRPIQIPRLVIQTNLRALMGGSLLGGGASGGAAGAGGSGGGGILTQVMEQVGVVRIMLDAKSIQSQ